MSFRCLPPSGESCSTNTVIGGGEVGVGGGEGAGSCLIGGSPCPTFWCPGLSSASRTSHGVHVLSWNEAVVLPLSPLYQDLHWVWLSSTQQIRAIHSPWDSVVTTVLAWGHAWWPGFPSPKCMEDTVAWKRERESGIKWKGIWRGRWD